MMGARASRAVFWSFLVLNGVLALGLAALTPPHWTLLSPLAHGGVTLPALPARPFITLWLYLPAFWMGAARLHDIGRRGWPVLLPLLTLAGVLILPTTAMRTFFTLVMLDRDLVPDAETAEILVIAAVVPALLIVAGTLHTIFLWLQPGDDGDNDYGPVPRGAPPAKTVADAPGGGLLPPVIFKGRLPRLLFWLVLIANVVLVRTLDYVLATEFNPTTLRGSDGSFLLSLLHTLLYLPSFYAAVLRLQDRDQPGTLVLALLLVHAAAPFLELLLDSRQITVMNLAINFATLYLLFLCWQPGTADDNRYGPPFGEKDTAEMPPQTPAAPVAARTVQAVAVSSSRPRSFGRRGA